MYALHTECALGGINVTSGIDERALPLYEEILDHYRAGGPLDETITIPGGNRDFQIRRCDIRDMWLTREGRS